MSRQNGIVQMMDGDNPIYPITKTEAVKTASDTFLEAIIKALDLANLSSVKGYLFRGVISTDITPDTPEQPVFYLAAPGSYTHFGSSFTINPGFIGIIRYNDSWSCESLQVGTAEAVKYTPQELSDEDKIQARTNIGAVSNENFDSLENRVGVIELARNVVTLNFTDSNYITPSNGQVLPSSSSAFKATLGYIACRQQTLLLIKIRFAQGSNAGMAFYDENGNFISSYITADSQLTQHSIVIPKTAAYFRVSGFFPSDISVNDVVCELVSFGNGVYDMLMGENYRIDGGITYNVDHVASSFRVIWADGVEGGFTGMSWDATYKMYLGYEVTYESEIVPGKWCKVVQPAVTMNPVDYTVSIQPKLKIELVTI